MGHAIANNPAPSKAVKNVSSTRGFPSRLEGLALFGHPKNGQTQSFIQFHMNITMDTFGGERAVMDKLADLGLITKSCSVHHVNGSWSFETDRKFPASIAQSVTKSFTPRICPPSRPTGSETFRCSCWSRCAIPCGSPRGQSSRCHAATFAPSKSTKTPSVRPSVPPWTRRSRSVT